MKADISRPWGRRRITSMPEPSDQAESVLTRTCTLRGMLHPPALEAFSFGIWTVLGAQGQMYGGQVPLSQAGELDSVPGAMR